MSVGQMFLGLISLFVATVVYRWQKGLDRQAQANIELRDLATKYATVSHTLFLQQPYVGEELSEVEIKTFYGISDLEIELYTLRDQIYVAAPKRVVDAVLHCDQAFRKWKITFPEIGNQEAAMLASGREATTNFKFSHENMLLVLRSEFEAMDRAKAPLWLLDLFSKFSKKGASK